MRGEEDVGVRAVRRQRGSDELLVRMAHLRFDRLPLGPAGVPAIEKVTEELFPQRKPVVGVGRKWVSPCLSHHFRGAAAPRWPSRLPRGCSPATMPWMTLPDHTVSVLDVVNIIVRTQAVQRCLGSIGRTGLQRKG